MIFLRRALEARPDLLVTRAVRVPPGTFEIQHGGVTFAEHRPQVGRSRPVAQAPRRIRPVGGVSWHAVETRPFMIGVAGGSSSGKTTVSRRVLDLTGGDHLSLIELDSYYLDRSDEPLEQRKKVNYDHPDAFDWALLNDHLAALANGASVPVPIYDYSVHNRSDEVHIVEPARIVVVDGILVLWERTLRERFDLKIFVDTAADIRLIRRMQRDVAERDRTPEFVIEQYLDTVRPAHERFVEPSKRYADVIIPEGGMNRPAIDVLLARVRELVNDEPGSSDDR
jgi:uridine kinase